MRKSRFTESQIVAILKQADGGVPIKDVVRQHGISVPTYYKWKSKYGGWTWRSLPQCVNWKWRTASSSGCMPNRRWRFMR